MCLDNVGSGPPAKAVNRHSQVPFLIFLFRSFLTNLIAKIRRACFIQGKPIKQICRELRVYRNTLRNVVRSGATEFRQDRSMQSRPKIDPWRSDLDEMLSCVSAPLPAKD